jgi:glycosyltransferase involved in cell wall biosynthesis
MRVALVLGPSTGGIGVHVRDLAEYCVGRGDRVVVAAPAPTGERFGFPAVGARFVPLPENPAAGPLALRRVISGADVVHSHGLRAAALTNLARAALPAPVRHVVTLHNAVLHDGMRGRVSGLVERLAIRPADLVLGASADLVGRAHVLGARRAEFRAVPAPPLPAPARRRDALRAELGVPEGTALVLAVGRLAPQKSYPLLLDAVAALTSDRGDATSGTAAPPVRVVIAGDGPQAAELAALIEERALPISLLGRRDDIADLLAAADVFVLCSRWEARALVVQEALRAGVPVVATAVGGIPGLVGDAAVLVPWSDPGALASALREVLADEALRAELRRAGPARAAAWPARAEALEKIRAEYSAFTPRIRRGR